MVCWASGCRKTQLLSRGAFCKDPKIAVTALCLGFRAEVVSCVTSELRLPRADQEPTDIRQFNNIEFKTEFIFSSSAGAAATGHAHRVLVMGHFDGANSFVVRFSPMWVGPWSYTTLSNDPKLVRCSCCVQPLKNDRRCFWPHSIWSRRITSEVAFSASDP